MFIEQGFKGKNDWWRTLITTIVSTIFLIASIITYFSISKEEYLKILKDSKSDSNNLSLFYNLFPFVFLLGILLIFVQLLHKRNIISLVTFKKNIDFGKIFFSFSLIVIISIITFFISYLNNNSGIELNFNPFKFSILLIISLVLFPFQISYEEFLFRGYLMQQIGVILKNRWSPLIITSVTFGLMHCANPEVSEMGFGVMVFYIGTGFLLGIMTLMDESMELAIGFHLGNNLMASILITSSFSALETDAIFKYTKVQDSATLLNEMIISILIAYPIILFIFSKKYGWSNWKEKLTGNIKDETLLEFIKLGENEESNIR